MIIEVGIEGEDDVRRWRLKRNDHRFDVTVVGSGRNGELENESTEAPTTEASDRVIDWRRPEPGVYSLVIDDRSYEVFVDPIDGDDGLYEVHLLNRTFRVRALDSRRLRFASAASVTDGQVHIAAPMPGRIVKVLCDDGCEVKAGDGIIVLEAMKMENELKAPRDGRVVNIAVEEGQGVEGGAHLATIE